MAGVAAVFFLPVIVIGGDLYPPQEWVRGGVWTLVTSVVGFTMQRLMTKQRRLADELRARAAGLKASTDLLEGTLRASTEYAIVATDPEGVITVFNSGAERMVGYTADEMIGETPGVYHDLVDIQERAEGIGLDVTEFILGAAREGRADTRQMTYVHKDGHRIPVEVTVSAMRDGDGRVNGFIAISSDISERLRVETALRASEAALFAVSRVSKEIADSTDARQSICDAAIEVCGADIAVLFEPEGAKRLEMTASSGVDLPAITIRLDAEPSGTGTAFLTGERLFAADSVVQRRRLSSIEQRARRPLGPLRAGPSRRPDGRCPDDRLEVATARAEPRSSTTPRACSPPMRASRFSAATWSRGSRERR